MPVLLGLKAEASVNKPRVFGKSVKSTYVQIQRINTSERRKQTSHWNSTQ